MYTAKNWLKNSIYWFIVFQGMASSCLAQLRINEVLAINSSLVTDPDFGEFSDFVELYHAGLTPLSLEGYSISDDPENVRKWVFPNVQLQPGQYLTLWADGRSKVAGDTAFSTYKNAVIEVEGLHLNFRLSGGGERLMLYDPQKNMLDELAFCIQSNDVSFGRNPQNPGEWLYYAAASPGKINSVYGSALMERAGNPVFSLAEGFYTQAQMLELNPATGSGVVRFTFDGSTPTEQSPLFDGAFELNRNYVIKARVYEPGKLPGVVVTKTFFIGEKSDFPVVSISSDEEHLFGFDFGILLNAIKDREIPAFIEYFEPGGARAFHSGVGVRIFGTTIYNLPQRPISVRFKAKFGDENLEYALFEDKPIKNYSAFLLRNGGNDYNMAYFRDGLAVNLIKNKMDLDHQDYKPCLVFINGAYHGIYELRERLDEQYLAANHRINDSNLDYLEDNMAVVSGDKTDYEGLMHYIGQHDLGDSLHYQHVAGRMDIDEYINFMIHRVFIGYKLADHNNRYWRDKDTNSPWRWIAADMEHAFGQLSGDNYMENTLEKLMGQGAALPEWSTFLFKNLLKNTRFRDEFAQRFAFYLDRIYHPQRTLALADSLKQTLEPYMPRHIGRWHTPSSMAAWQNNVNFIKTFLQNRPAYIRQQLAAAFNLKDSAEVHVSCSEGGRLRCSGVLLTDTSTSIYLFKNSAISLQAIPQPGYRFVKWIGVASTTANAWFIPDGDTSFRAVFEPRLMSVIPAKIDKDTVLSAALSPWYAFEHVTVNPGVTLGVEAGATLLMNEGISVTVRGALRMEGTPESRIRVQSNPDQHLAGLKLCWGSIVAEAATDTLIIRYVDFRDGSTGIDSKRHFATLSLYDSPLRMEHCSVSGGMAPLFAQGGKVYIGYSSFHTFNRCNGFVSLNQMSDPIVEYCDFKGNKAPDTDAIDLKNIQNARIRFNHIRDFLGSNCDGIDLGIHAANNLLEYNHIHDCTDKGISIGSQSNALIRHNLIYDCDLGIAVKDSLSVAFGERNTLYGNRYAVACYEKSALRGGGKAKIKDSILAASRTSDILTDLKSSVELSHSITDREGIDGLGNLFGDPLLVNPAQGNFELSPESPCINAGDPSSTPDPDGSVADMGAHYTHLGISDTSILLNEVHYHPPFNYTTGDWIEIHNKANQPKDLSYWTIRHGQQQFSIKPNTMLQAGDYLVFCRDTQLIQFWHPGVGGIQGNPDFELDDNAGKIALYDADGQLVHSLRYADASPWPTLPDGHGASLELKSGAIGRHVADWRESYVLMGTPGAPNSTAPDFTGLYINEIAALNTSHPDEAGEFDDWFELYNASPDTMHVGGLYFSDNLNLRDKTQLPLNFPEKTSIPPMGFLLLWADEDPEQGILHLDFKLSASGETLGVFQKDEQGLSTLELLDPPPQTANQSWGRYPDGGVFLTLMDPSPGASNGLSGVRDDEGGASLRAWPNPFKDWLFIETGSLVRPYRLELFNGLGNRLYAAESLEQDRFSIQRQNLPAGLIWIVLIDAQGRRYTGRVMAD